MFEREVRMNDSLRNPVAEPLFNPLSPADLTYAGKIFTDTPDDPYLPEDAVRGGSGYDLSVALPDEVERMKPDWSLWPLWTRDMGYSSRGCPRRCPFCIVPEKDGPLRVVAEFGDIWTGHRQLELLDGNATAAPIEHFRKLCADATAAACRLSFSQGLDARLLTDEHAAIIRRSLTTKAVHMAFDNLRDEAAVRAAVETFKHAGFPISRLMFYVLIGYDSGPVGVSIGPVELSSDQFEFVAGTATVTIDWAPPTGSAVLFSYIAAV